MQENRVANWLVIQEGSSSFPPLWDLDLLSPLCGKKLKIKEIFLQFFSIFLECGLNLLPVMPHRRFERVAFELEKKLLSNHNSINNGLSFKKEPIVIGSV